MNDSTSNGSHLVFGEFLEHLRRQGFAIGVDHHLRLQELLNRISAHCAPSDLKTFLCPIFATNKKQQTQFYSAFDSYFDLFQAALSEEGSTPDRAAVEWYPLVLKGYEPVAARKWPYVLAGTLLLILIVLAAAVISPVPREPKSISPPEIAQTPSESDSQPQVEQTPPFPTSKGEQPEVEQAEPSPAPALKPELPFYQRYGNAIRLTAVLTPLIFFLFYEWYRFNRRKLVLQKQRGKKPPYVWPMRVEEHPRKLYDSEEFYTTARLMRRRQVDEFRRLDVNATIAATIESLGYPSFRYKSDSKPPEYLALIDRASVRDHQAQLFDELVNDLEHEGIFIARYFYNGDPRVCCSKKGDCFHLEELHDRHPGHRLLIFGDGEKIIDPITGKLETWATVFSEWQDRAILTPEFPSQWGLREITLASEFILLPARVDGLRVVVDQFESSVAGDLRIWRQNGSETPPRELDQPGVVEALRRYLGEETFQWLCACAVYPELQWDLTLYMASLPCMEAGLAKEKNLLKLTRLPYFRSGTMPDDLRWRLISELDRDKERAIRSAIIDLLEKDPPPKETFAEDRHRLNLVVQRWLYRRSRKTRREMLRVLRASPPSRVAQDYTLLRFLESPRASPLDLLLPRRLRSLFYRDGIPAFGLKTSARLLMTLVMVALAWIVLKPPASPKSPDQTADTPTSIADVYDLTTPPGMVYVPGGEFTMGYNGSDEEAEKPEHAVKLAPFFIDRYEVTVGDYYQFVKTGNGGAPTSWPASWKEGRFKPEEAKLPVTDVTWFDARDYARSVGKRLPTEEEWEYAARGTDKRLYPWGNDFNPKYANVGDPKREAIRRVGSYPVDKSPFEVSDMAGNVFEWTGSDWSAYPNSKAAPVAGKIVRGGSYSRDRFFARATSRGILRPDAKQEDVGFRCVKDARRIAPIAPSVTITAGTQDENATRSTSVASGSIILGPVDDDVTVFIDGRNAADFKIKRSTPKEGNQIELADVPEGYHTLRITGRNIADWKRTVQVRGGATTYIATTFQPAVVSFVVKSEPGAEIYIDGVMVGKTSDRGEIRIPDRYKPGWHAIRAEKDKFQPAEKQAIFNTGDAVIELRLDPWGPTTTTGALEGRVVDLTNGMVPGARVSVINEEIGFTRAVITDSNGAFFFGSLPPGHYKVTASKKGYLDTSISGFAVRLAKVNFLIPPITLQPATVRRNLR